MPLIHFYRGYNTRLLVDNGQKLVFLEEEGREDSLKNVTK